MRIRSLLRLAALCFVVIPATSRPVFCGSEAILLEGTGGREAGIYKGSRFPTTRADCVPSQDLLTLSFPGAKGPVPYEKFGRFEDLGTPRYRYEVTDRAGLARAAGEGIYPNQDVFKDRRYRELQKEGKLQGNHWRFVDTRAAELNFYKWASAAEDPGVKQFYAAIMFERLGLIEEAVKGFYAVAVHFPKSVGYTYFSTPWYMGPSSLDRMEQLLRRHPKLKMRWTGGSISVQGKFDAKTANDVFAVDPGRLVQTPSPADRRERVGVRANPAVPSSQPSPILRTGEGAPAVVQTIGGPKVQLKKYANGHWRLFVDGRPFPVKAVTYSVTPVGRSPDRGTWNASKDWQLLDTNQNGLHDGFFDAGDARLLKDLGANTLRAYHHLYDKELFRRLHKEYGFYVLCGDLLGGYAVGSGATWDKGTDYRDSAQQERMLSSVRQMVEGYKDEPYILMWVLGNENVYGVGNNSGRHPEAFFDLVDRAAKLIHELDPSRPVALANGDLLFLDIIRRKCPHIDVMGANVYRGEQGFGRRLFLDVREQLDKPALITEFGAPAYAENYAQEEAEAYQAMYLANNWEDLEAHRAGRGAGNALGGVLFEYIDEWWKANSDLPLKVQKEKADWYAPKSAIYKNLQPENHDAVPQFGGPFLDGWSYEEWFGLASMGSGKGSPFERILRPAYFRMKEVWNAE